MELASSVYTAVLFRLDRTLAATLQSGLASCGCNTLDAGTASELARADVIFCPAVPALVRKALKAFRGKPVIVVSRLPEVGGWLDSLELGAADYCTAPFEPMQLRWLLDTHLSTRRTLAAA